MYFPVEKTIVEPCCLSFGILAGRDLQFIFTLLEGNIAPNVGRDLRNPDGAQHRCVVGKAEGEQGFNLLYRSGCQHFPASLIDASMQLCAIRHQHELPSGDVLQKARGLVFVEVCKGLSGCEHHFQRARDAV